MSAARLRLLTKAVCASAAHTAFLMLFFSRELTRKQEAYISYQRSLLMATERNPLRTVENIKALLDACYQAKRIREMLPALPSGVTPSYIHFLDVIQIMERQGAAVKISDISDYLNIPRPGVTRTVKEMEKKGYLRKTNATEDGRITYISLTEEGRKLSEKYNENYFAGLAPYLESISEADAEAMIHAIETFYQVMCERREYFEK